MSKKKRTTKGTPKAVEYRIFNLPGHGRVRAPVTMTEESLLAAMREDEPDDTPK
ncbi:MAG: hypothetical protein KIH44_009590 [Octadecabacter sp.]|nr:hypothetical protein [Octadecabacter sp.]